MEPTDRAYWSRHHPWENIDAEGGVTQRVDVDDSRIVERVVAAYRRSAGKDFYGSDSMWRGFLNDKQRDLDTLLLTGSTAEIGEMLKSPKDNYLLYGFDNLFRDAHEIMRRHQAGGGVWGKQAKDHLVRLAEALGALRVENPEGGPWLANVQQRTGELVALIEAKLGVPLAAPWFWEGVYGLAIKGGVIAHRDIHAAYCAHRVRQLSVGPVLEIGAGLGRVARYARLMGIAYTIVDLPMTNVAQGYFLLRTLGEDAVSLEGEPPKPLRVVTPTHLESGERYALVVNVDGLTEMGRETAVRYLDWAMAHAGRLWSVNHEANRYTVAELAAGLNVTRHPDWMRRGYVEELIRNEASLASR